MRIHLLSDLHNEFSSFVPVLLDCDLVILAGDIDLKSRGVEWAKKTFSVPVLYVPGNHEFYGGHLTHTLEINVTLGHLNLESFGYKQGTDYYQKRQGQHLKGGACQ